ncbi:lipoyl(octanoyl) transferase [cyanobiont of Ornithocercus magnificus]|nr:lipoyl(octanoyl) transferase [cyanobiont of Ornithocercus magnificus]
MLSHIRNLESPINHSPTSAAILLEPQKPVSVELAWHWQRAWQHHLLQDPSGLEAVWILQHKACYTLGRGATEDHLLFSPAQAPLPLHRIDRGGEVTHHLPGQLVVYPVLDLKRRQNDLHWYMRQLEQVVLDVLAGLDLTGERLEGLTGVWLEKRKVAAIGVGCRRWITQHGLALNVTCSLEGFDAIVPCGLAGRTVGSLNQWLPNLREVDVQPLLRCALAHRLSLNWLEPAMANLARPMI